MGEYFEAFSLESAAKELPIETKKLELLYTIEMSSVTLVVGETGSGKSTKLPELLLRQGIYTGTG